MISKAGTVDDFLKMVSPDERAVFATIRALLKKAHPQVKESIKWRMPGYLIGENMVGALNKQKNYLCLYLNPEAVDPSSKDLGKLDCGESCLRFRKPADLPLDLVAKIITAAAKLAAG